MNRFFTVDKQNNRWSFFDPSGRLFFSLGMNHLDSATLRCAENVHIWREKYRNSQQHWLMESVGPDLRAWGFNTVGWCQEVVIAAPTIHRHSRNFTREEYGWLDMPYCHLLPFTEAHQWEVETRLPDVLSKDFSEWCDYVARDHCVRMADDPNLIGYFYSDCPQWVHSPRPEMKPPWFDPERLQTKSGREELARMAERYYAVTRESIRRYDPNHLILGDRFEALAPLPDEVLLAAARHVDVLSFQCFADGKTICEQFKNWHKQTGKPILLADGCVPGRRNKTPEDQNVYGSMLKMLRELSCCVGWHYCGAYLRNRVRRTGFREEDETINDQDFIAAVTAANHATAEWMHRL